ncbi:MAG: aspartate/ornithine carbamoyltransferase family protein, partial [Planctomycetia bacterium]
MSVRMHLGESGGLWSGRHLVGLEPLSADDVATILDVADAFRRENPRRSWNSLIGKVIVNLFFEDSTRTRTSCGLAARKLGANVVEFAAKSSSVNKGESFIDTARNLEALGADLVVVRHKTPGAPQLLTKYCGATIVNAGDGPHEHPTQGLLDVLTIRQVKGSVAGLTVGLVGDIAHSRVARSNIWALQKLGAKVIVCGPRTLVPPEIERLG